MPTNEQQQQAPEQTTTTTTTTNALPASAEPLVITVANTTERKQLPIERQATVLQLTSTSLALATGTATALSFVALLAPLQAPVAAFVLVGGSLLGLGVKSAYKGRIGLTEALLVASVVVGASASAIDLRQPPTSVYSQPKPTPQEFANVRQPNVKQPLTTTKRGN